MEVLNEPMHTYLKWMTKQKKAQHCTKWFIAIYICLRYMKLTKEQLNSNEQ